MKSFFDIKYFVEQFSLKDINLEDLKKNPEEYIFNFLESLMNDYGDDEVMSYLSNLSDYNNDISVYSDSISDWQNIYMRAYFNENDKTSINLHPMTSFGQGSDPGFLDTNCNENYESFINTCLSETHSYFELILDSTSHLFNDDDDDEVEVCIYIDIGLGEIDLELIKNISCEYKNLIIHIDDEKGHKRLVI